MQKPRTGMEKASGSEIVGVLFVCFSNDNYYFKLLESEKHIVRLSCIKLHQN